MYPFERFSENAKGVLTMAQEEAAIAHHSHIGTEHMLLGLIRDQHGLAGSALKALKVDYAATRAVISAILQGAPKREVKQITPTARVKRVIEMAFEEAHRERSSTVETGHLLVALLLEGEGVAAHVLQDHRVTVAVVRKELVSLRSGGKAEQSFTNGRPLNRVHHLDLSDPKGRAVIVDLLLPVEYSKEEEDQLASRVRDVVEGRGT